MSIPQFQAIESSTPSFSEFDPRAVPYQARVVDDMQFNFDYSLGIHEILLSGSVGSAKSILMAHCALKHVWTYARSRGCMARLAMPDLRDTIFMKLLEHIEGTVKTDGTLIREGKDFGFSTSTCSIWFSNGSEIISRSWSDKKFKKLGSLELSFAIVEELTENDGDFWKGIVMLRTRVGRLPHVPENWVMYATNPDSPEHPAYDYFQIGDRQDGRTEKLAPRRHVYFSRTHDNPFLPDWYTEGLLEDLDPKLARRLVYGEWVEIRTEVIYHSYGRANFVEADYEVDVAKPIYVSFDFNIGAGKPMSACLSQVALRDGKPVFHFFDEVVVEGADTEDLVIEMAGRGLLDYEAEYIVHGDAAGKARSTKSKTTDYDIIERGFARHRTPAGLKVTFEIDVPKANPPVRTRHNLVNAYCKNAAGATRLYVYQPCKMLDKGLKLTALKSNGQYVEDDRPAYQHVTTAAGYHIVSVHEAIKSRPTVHERKIR